ncbi:MAG: 50S ribosomal protein L13 [Candidatus Omnitrophica bacterium]|nr:50S ribosomal protein L13 [Candidatus Omnitrophota bacterium]
MKTTIPSTSQIRRQWLLVDAQGQVLGRLASRVAFMLRGKHKPDYTPHLDTGDFVVVTNAAKVKVTGKKAVQKRYTSYSGYPHGLKVRTFEETLRRHPDRVIRLAVKGMLQDGPLGRQLLSKLKVYPGANHPHAAQQPQLITLERSHGHTGR